MSLKKLWNSCMVLMVAALLAGCGGENPLSRQSISGTVTLNREPIASGTIRFEPVDEKGVAAGATITQGKYAIAAERGLPAGEYVVRISAAGEGVDPGEAPGDSSKLAEELVPAEYNTNSQLKVTIKAGVSEPQDFALTK